MAKSSDDEHMTGEGGGGSDDVSGGGAEGESHRFTRRAALGVGGSTFLGFALGLFRSPRDASGSGVTPGSGQAQLSEDILAALQQAELSYREETFARKRFDGSPVVAEVFAHGSSTTLAAAVLKGATNIKVVSTAGMNVGDAILIDTGANAEHQTISAIGTSGPGGTGLSLSSPLSREHAGGAAVTDLAPGGSTSIPGMPGGSMLIACGHSGSPLITAMQSAAQTGDAAVAGAAFTTFIEIGPRAVRHKRKRKLPKAPEPEDVAAKIKQVPVFADITYGGKLIAEGLPVTDTFTAAAAMVPFAGGAVRPERFVVSLYGASGVPTDDIRTVVLYRAPALTPLETQILATIPGEDFNQLAGGAERLAFCPLVEVAIELVELAVEFACPAVEAAANRAVVWVTARIVGGAVVAPDSGSLAGWLSDPENATLLEGVTPNAAVGTLLLARANFLSGNIFNNL